ncbi:hypothetical protein C9F11_38160 [Streptomyces sp. YIM 121038]|uniref:hypothetical protein n=1 Tax=Streptomyces sp. YIM 121038 TaxID=2136401 RepID=UPI001162C895|nr:hypothetical protein [Streptomyces sp. YIM 121038]QCX81215.1 hypothetical protein C9F11_38160 [Streptomyces sp. YIM 121038]
MGWVDKQHLPALREDTRYQRILALTQRLLRRDLHTRLAADLRQLEHRWQHPAQTAPAQEP